MGKEAERSALESAVSDIWVTDFGPIAWTNVPFEVPASGRWASVTILDYDTSRMSLGKEVFLKRTTGSIQIDLFCPQDLGSSLNRRAADFLETYFEDRIIVISVDEKIEFGTPESRESNGVQERQEGTDDNWYRTIVDIPFHRDEVVRK